MSMFFIPTSELIKEWRAVVHAKVREISKSHVIHEGLSCFSDGAKLSPSEVPGVMDAGWTPARVSRFSV